MDEGALRAGVACSRAWAWICAGVPGADYEAPPVVGSVDEEESEPWRVGLPLERPEDRPPFLFPKRFIPTSRGRPRSVPIGPPRWVGDPNVSGTCGPRRTSAERAARRAARLKLEAARAERRRARELKKLLPKPVVDRSRNARIAALTRCGTGPSKDTNSVRYKHMAAGGCADFCGKQALPNRSRCAECAAKVNLRSRLWHERNRPPQNPHEVRAKERHREERLMKRACLCHGLLNPEGDDHVFDRRRSTDQDQERRSAG